MSQYTTVTHILLYKQQPMLINNVNIDTLLALNNVVNEKMLF